MSERLQRVEQALENWAIRNGLFGMKFHAGMDFQYEIASQTVLFPILETENETTDIDFTQFFYEYGCEYDVSCFILSLFHEIGHHMTIASFSEEERDISLLDKGMIKWVVDHHERNYLYWMNDIEFAANVWAINFINTHMNVVKDLAETLKSSFAELYTDGQIYEIVDAFNEIALMEDIA